MKGFVQPGDTVTATAPYAVSSGGGFKIGSLFAVAKGDAASGASVEGLRRGIMDMAKATGEAWVAWTTKLYWDDTNKRLTSSSSGNLLVGLAAQNQASADAVGRALLTGQIV